jgi:hypothetical protein
MFTEKKPHPSDIKFNLGIFCGYVCNVKRGSGLASIKFTTRANSTISIIKSHSFQILLWLFLKSLSLESNIFQVVFKKNIFEYMSTRCMSASPICSNIKCTVLLLTKYFTSTHLYFFFRVVLCEISTWHDFIKAKRGEREENTKNDFMSSVINLSIKNMLLEHFLKLPALKISMGRT